MTDALNNLPPNSSRAARLRSEYDELQRKRTWREQQRDRARTEGERATVTLRYRDIAHILNAPTGSISTQVMRLRQELSKAGGASHPRGQGTMKPSAECPSATTLSAWLDDELDTPTSEMTRSHIRECQVCREQTLAWVEVVRVLPSHPTRNRAAVYSPRGGRLPRPSRRAVSMKRDWSRTATTVAALTRPCVPSSTSVSVVAASVRCSA